MSGWLAEVKRVASRDCCWLVLVSLCSLLGCVATAPPAPAGVAPVATASANFSVDLQLDDGDLQLSFDSSSAPLAVAELKRVFQAGGFNGVAVEWIRPHIEIRTGVPMAAPAAIRSELDAVALGLDRVLIADAGAAMGLIQMELEPALLRAGANASPQLLAWVREWRQHFDPAFLVGTSRQQINEALGYRYQRGYASRPVRRGSVALLPTAPGQTSLALAIVLFDQPDRDGRWVVVGQVRSGLDLAERLSIATRVHPKFNAPRTPALIQHTTLAPGRR